MSILATAACVAPSSAGFVATQQGAPLVTVTHDASGARESGGNDATAVAVAAGDRAYRWRQPGALRLYVQTTSPLPDFTTRHLTLVDEAVRAWEASGVVRVERVAWPYEADIRLYWTDRLPPTNPGVTLLYRGRGGSLTRADMFISARPAPWTTGTPDRVLYGTIAHELGHALGLPHDPDVEALMHAAPLVTHVTPGDITRLTHIAGGE